ncbi:hypothetical protein BHE74_00015756 [Ensete ventricosum]|nr:hypothetical protein BHE74_00015756 [Ensete ventricosum]
MESSSPQPDAPGIGRVPGRHHPLPHRPSGPTSDEDRWACRVVGPAAEDRSGVVEGLSSMVFGRSTETRGASEPLRRCRMLLRSRRTRRALVDSAMHTEARSRGRARGGNPAGSRLGARRNEDDNDPSSPPPSSSPHLTH